MNITTHDRRGYANGCRCDSCRAANAAYSKMYRQQKPKSQFVETRSCERCGKEFGVTHRQAKRPSQGRFCSRVCAHAGRVKSATERTSRRAVYQKDHPLAGARGRVLVARATLYDRLGAGSHPCHWCGQLATWTVRPSRGISRGELAVDHLDGNPMNDDPANLVAVCNDCNTLRAFVRGWVRRTGLPIETLL